ncbi:hypothetical protein MMC22_000663 [Lobaria immixta]|nr:hypothetical protein [Lobaria immixta]
MFKSSPPLSKDSSISASMLADQLERQLTTSTDLGKARYRTDVPLATPLERITAGFSQDLSHLNPQEIVLFGRKPCKSPCVIPLAPTTPLDIMVKKQRDKAIAAQPTSLHQLHKENRLSNVEATLFMATLEPQNTNFEAQLVEKYLQN